MTPDAAPLAPAAAEIDVREHLGEHLDLGLQFVDHEGRTVKLGDYFDGQRPVLLTLNYYRCPVLCNVQLNALTDAMAGMEWKPGDENFRVVTVSIDPREDASLAKQKRGNHLALLGKGDDVDWAFLTGDASSIRLLAAQVGFGYTYDRDQDQYAHPASIMFVSPDGKIARYLYGLTYEPRDLKFALMDASEGKVGSVVDRFVQSCFHYDATLGKYGPYAMGIMRIGGAITVLVVGLGLLILWRRERRRNERPLEVPT